MHEPSADASLNAWREAIDHRVDRAAGDSGRILAAQLQTHLADVYRRAHAQLPEKSRQEADYVAQMAKEIPAFGQGRHEAAEVTSRRLFFQDQGADLVARVAGRPVRTLALVPATKIVLENLHWFQKHFETVLVGDNFKCGQVHHGQKVLPVAEVLSRDVDAFVLTTNTADIEAAYRQRLPPEKTVTIGDLCNALDHQKFQRSGLARAQRIVAQIEAADKPLVVLGVRLQVTTEPTFEALDTAGYDVFVLTVDGKGGRGDAAYDDACVVPRNALTSPLEQLYILTHLKKGMFWIYYDFYSIARWDAVKCMVTYANAAALMGMAQRPVILGMYDVTKPISINMHRRHEAFALYKVMFEMADAAVLTGHSEHVSDYLRNTLCKDKPVTTFYRYSYPVEEPLPRLSDTDGERHLVAVSTFMGEVFEPNRIDMRRIIRLILKQNIHFHYYSNSRHAHDFRAGLPPEEQAYFHVEQSIWNQRDLIRELSRYDFGWGVGDEITTFGKLAAETDDLNMRELYSLFIPNSTPSSSLAYACAGLGMFMSRLVKVMDDVYPKGCCIFLDVGEVGNLGTIGERMDWNAIHATMREERERFDIFAQIPRLVAFLDALPEP